jgi:hypothetical protein
MTTAPPPRILNASYTVLCIWKRDVHVNSKVGTFKWCLLSTDLMRRCFQIVLVVEDVRFESRTTPAILTEVFFGPFRWTGGIVPRLRHNRLLPSPFKFIIHFAILYYVAADSIVLYPTRIAHKSYSCKRKRRPIGLWDVEAHTFALDNRLTIGGEVVSLTRRPPFTRRKIPGTHFC